MRFILSSHPRLFVPAETGFLPFLDTDPTAFLTMDQVSSILDRIGRMNLDWANLVTDLSVFYTSLPVPNLPQTINALYQIKVASHVAPRWGDKTPSYVQHMPVIQKIFPQAQFIHIIRDGRDTALSAIDKWGSLRRAYLTDYYLLAHWVRNVEQGRKFGQIQKEKNYFEVQYEDLVQDPEPTIRGICDFLDESFHPNMLDHTPLALQTIGSEGHVEVKAPIRTTSLRRWEAEMEPFRKKLADNLAGPTLRALGYPLSNLGRFRYSEKIKVELLCHPLLDYRYNPDSITASWMAKTKPRKTPQTPFENTKSIRSGG